MEIIVVDDVIEFVIIVGGEVDFFVELVLVVLLLVEGVD